MRRRSLLILAAVGLIASLAALPLIPAAGESPVPAAPNLGAQLRYIGRDTATGMAATVNDRFIAEVERSYAVYGIEETGAIPPPPAAGNDIVRLAVPALGIDAPVQRFGVDRYGRLDIPQDTSTIGWNPAYSSLPGEGGSTFFAAHYEYGGRPGVFRQLSTLPEDAIIAVSLSDGTTANYRVTSVVDYVLESIDMGAILRGREGRESITLMTCSGVPNARGYSERTVVLAERADG